MKRRRFDRYMFDVIGYSNTFKFLTKEERYEMACKEEREKAINAFKETNNYLLEEINKGNHLTPENTLSKFKELLNK